MAFLFYCHSGLFGEVKRAAWGICASTRPILGA